MAENKGTILIVDDEEDIRQLLCKRLESEGYHCEETGNTDEVLADLRDNQTDVVLLDIKMPGKSGLELLRKVKEYYPDVVVIMATVFCDIDTAIECIRNGSYDYITKPFNMGEVVYCVERAIHKRRLELEVRDYQQRLEQKIEEQAKEIHETFLGAMAALSFALEAKDSYTAGHSRRVTEIAMAIGRKLALKKGELEDLCWGGLLHDIGKIAVNQFVINKHGRLTAEEYKHVMTHSIVGASLVRPVVRNKRIVDIVEHHHTRYDGSGVNQKLKGKNIPLLARIVAVADAYDAMTSTRPYRPRLSREEALIEIRREIGRQFDPLVANTFLGMSAADMMPEKKKIVIADDEESIRLLVKSALSNNYTVIEAADGQEAVEAAQKQAPDLILMDILMPGKDGLQACHEIKTNLATKAIPVIMLTAIGQELDKRLSTGLGADQYITKPFNPRGLVEIVGQFLKDAERV